MSLLFFFLFNQTTNADPVNRMNTFTPEQRLQVSAIERSFDVDKITVAHCNQINNGNIKKFVNSVDLLGVPLYADLKVNHMHRNVQKFYCKNNSVLFDFKNIPCASDVNSKLIDTYCLDLYGSQLWKYSKNDVNAFYTAWRKVVRRIRKILSTTHCNLLPSINKSLLIEFLTEKRRAKFIWSCFNNPNLIVRNILLAAKISVFQILVTIIN